MERRVAEEAESRRQKERRLHAALEAEHRRKEEREEQAAEAEEDLASKIDLYIRTSENFDTRDPRAYKCPISSIHEDAEVKDALKNLNEFYDMNEYYDVSLEEFIRNEPSFICSDDKSQVGVRYLTPFQGDDGHRVFGCDERNYPYRQHPLGKKDNNGDESSVCLECITMWRRTTGNEQKSHLQWL